MEKRPQFDVPRYEGYLSIEVGDLYYREFGTGEEVLVGLHGGPGAAHDYLAPLTDIAGEDWTLYLYDQYGCGRPTGRRRLRRVHDGRLPGPPRRGSPGYRRGRAPPLRPVVGRLAGARVRGRVPRAGRLPHPGQHVGGHSAGRRGDVGRRPRRHRRGGPRGVPSARRGPRLRRRHGGVQRDVRRRTHPSGRRGTVRVRPRYQRGRLRRHVGAAEFRLAETARLRDWSVTDRLDEVDCPTLVITGEHDEVSPVLAREMADAIQNARLEEFGGASHLPLWEEREAHTEVLEEFLSSVA